MITLTLFISGKRVYFYNSVIYINSWDAILRPYNFHQTFFLIMHPIFQKTRNKMLKEINNISFFKTANELAYQAALEKHQSNLPILSAADLALVETIRKEGAVITSLEALSIPSTGEMLQAAKSLIPEIPKSISGDKNEYVVHASDQQIMKYPELFMWGLQERLLNIIENYIALPVAYHGVYLRRDIANQVEEKSRLWHLDKEDRKVLKVIIYLHDVGDDDGPFQYIPQSLTPAIARSLKYNYRYIKDSVIKQHVSSLDCKSCTGAAGTVVIAGSGSIFHRGKIPSSGDRFTLFFDYTSKQPYTDYSSLPKEHLVTLAKKYFSPKQKNYVLW
jgi:hypothetical protein